MPDNPDIELAKLDLEREKLEFERRKFDADGARRFEELAKLKADREKTELDAKDLLIPYKQRSAYKVAVFQGRATVIGALVALLSLLTLKPIYDAFQAKQSQTIAEQAAIEAKKQQAVADQQTLDAKAALSTLAKDKARLDTQVNVAHQQLLSLQAQVTEAQQEAAVANIQDILDGIAKHPEDDPRQILRESLDTSAELRPFREHFLVSIARDREQPAVLRFYLLSVLYERSLIKRDASSLRDQIAYRRDLLGVATEPDIMLGSTIPIIWPSLNQAFGNSVVGYYACENYDKASKKMLGGFDDSMSQMANFISDQYGDNPACYDAVLDSLINKNNSASEADKTRGFAQIFLFRSMNILMSPVGVREFHYPQSSFQMLSDLPPYVTDNKDRVPLLTIKQHFPIFFDVLGDLDLRKLRSCSPAILKPLKKNQWLEEVQLSAYCPVDKWRQ